MRSGSIAAALTASLGQRPTAADANHLYAAPIVLDNLAALVKGLAIVGGAILVLLSWDEVPDKQAAEYHACLLVIVAGTSLVGMANELITLFIALELISIPTAISTMRGVFQAMGISPLKSN